MEKSISRRRFFQVTGIAALGATAGLVGCGSAVSSNASASSSASTSASAVASASSASASSTAQAGSSQAAAKRPIVVFFSQTGNTAAIAAHIAEHVQADSFELKAAEPYKDEDLDYNDSSTRATVEQNTPDARPAIAELPANLDAYDVVYLGYPIWWGKVPRIMCTFAEGCDLSGKTIVPFCTSGSSDIGSSADELAALASPSAKWIPGKRFAAGADSQTVSEWLDNLAL